jgi:hypothetical protein
MACEGFERGLHKRSLALASCRGDLYLNATMINTELSPHVQYLHHAGLFRTAQTWPIAAAQPSSSNHESDAGRGVEDPGCLQTLQQFQNCNLRHSI